MGKFIDLGLRKPRAGSTRDNWTVSFGGLLTGYHLQVVGDHRDIENFMNAGGHALQQTEVIGTAHSEPGTGYAFDIFQQDGKELGTDADRGRLYSDLRDQLGPSSDIVPGFQPIERDGRPGIRIVKFHGPMSDDDVNELKAAVARVLASRNYTVSGEHGPIDIIGTGNDWRENPNGQSYASRLVEAGRPDLLEWLNKGEHWGAGGPPGTGIDPASRPPDWPEWKTEEFPPSGYKPHPDDDTFYPRNPNERRKPQ